MAMQPGILVAKWLRQVEARLASPRLSSAWAPLGSANLPSAKHERRRPLPPEMYALFNQQNNKIRNETPGNQPCRVVCSPTKSVVQAHSFGYDGTNDGNLPFPRRELTNRFL
jgi:hypothetical protein